MEGRGNSAKAQDVMENVYSSVGLWILVQRAFSLSLLYPRGNDCAKTQLEYEQKGRQLSKKRKAVQEWKWPREPKLEPRKHPATQWIDRYSLSSFHL